MPRGSDVGVLQRVLHQDAAWDMHGKATGTRLATTQTESPQAGAAAGQPGPWHKEFISGLRCRVHRCVRAGRM